MKRINAELKTSLKEYGFSRNSKKRCWEFDNGRNHIEISHVDGLWIICWSSSEEDSVIVQHSDEAFESWLDSYFLT